MIDQLKRKPETDIRVVALGKAFAVILKCFGSLSYVHGNLRGVYFVLAICKI